MKFIDYCVYSGEENMKIDSDILEKSIKNSSCIPVFRLYGWSPACVSLGKNQKDDFINSEFLKNSGIDIVRRMTGGRALLHDKELTYSFTAPVSFIKNGDNVIESYKFISGILIKIFSEIGVELTIGGLERHVTHNNYCMAISTGADLCYKGKKFIGSAQCRKKGYILQHGSILLDYNKKFLNDLFREKTDFSTIISLKEINPELGIPDIIASAKKVLASISE